MGIELGARPIDFLPSRFAARATCVSYDNSGVYRDFFSLDQTGGHATANDFVKHLPTELTFTKVPMTIPQERRVIWHCIFQTKTAEPAISQRPVHGLAGRRGSREGRDAFGFPSTED